jgi:hypothetical protein
VALESRFALTQGSDHLRWYQSSLQSKRGFCDTCGSTLFFMSTVCPGEVHVARALIDGEVDRAPTAHVFYDQHVDWFAVGDDLPRAGADHPGLARYRAIEPDQPM